MTAIRTAGPGDLPAFFAYLDGQLATNGMDGAPLHHPMARGERFPDERRAAFAAAVAVPFGQAGWRRLWLAHGADGAIAGHVDLRAHPDPGTSHRALLGMGVHRDWRRQGLGIRLLDTATAWAAGDAGLAWIDLEVLSVNAPARALYLRAGFSVVGEYPDMFRIDGETHGYTLMTRRL